MKQIIIPIRGMHCRSCELLIERKLKQIQGVRSVNVSYGRGQAYVRHGSDIPSTAEMTAAIREAGYEVGIKERLAWLSRDPAVYREAAIAAAILGVLYLAAKSSGLFGLDTGSKDVSLPMALGIGLIAGVSTCMALVGGLIMGVAARHAEVHPEATTWQKFRPHLYFNVGRVSGYAFFGGLLGAVGSVFKLSNGILILMTLVVGAVMVVLGLKLTGLSPRLKEGSLTLPPGLARRFGLAGHKKEYSHSSAMITGALTFFLPCGFTQAMQLYAVSTGSYGRGAAVMALFALGTAPALLGIGGLTSVIKGAVARRFYAVIGMAVLLFGLFNVNNGLALAGFDTSVTRPKGGGVAAQQQAGVQIVRMTQKAGSYVPNVFTVKPGVRVRWIIDSESEYSCAASLVVPSLGISRRLRLGENVIEFTPKTAGSIPFSCSMGMYRGVFNVVADGGKAPPANNNATASPPPAGSSCGGGGGGCGCGAGVNNPRERAAPAKVDPKAGVQAIAAKDDWGLSPNEFTVQAGIPVEWTVTGQPVGCMTGFFSRELGINAYQNYTGNTMIKFTPTRPGDFDVTCPMGMWRATIHVRK